MTKVFEDRGASTGRGWRRHGKEGGLAPLVVDDGEQRQQELRHRALGLTDALEEGDASEGEKTRSWMAS